MNKFLLHVHLFVLLGVIITAPPVLAEDNSGLILDREILNLLELVETGQLEAATRTSARLQSDYPGSRVVQLIYADLQNTLAFRHVSMDSRENFSRRLLELLNELKARKKNAEWPVADGAIPENIIQAGKNTRHIIAVDLSRSRLYLLERADATSAFRLREDHYVSIGLGGIGKNSEGDLKTPVGIYRIDDFKTDDALPELYGTGAFTLDFPNDLDRQNGINGSGIWLHGMPRDQLSRPPLTSEGCVVMRNALVTHLLSVIDRKTTPVILADTLQWIIPHDNVTLANSLATQINNHPPPLQIARSGGSDQPEANSGNMFQEFAARQQLRAEDLEIFRYPAISLSDTPETLYQVRFLQRSDVEEDDLRPMQTQYWRFSSDGSRELVSQSPENR